MIHLTQTIADLARLRSLHVEMAQAVAAAYGASDLDPGHGFHTTKQGERCTISEPARRTVLHHQRHQEEVAAGLHEPRKPKRSRPQAKSQAHPIQNQGEFF